MLAVLSSAVIALRLIYVPSRLTPPSVSAAIDGEHDALVPARIDRLKPPEGQIETACCDDHIAPSARVITGSGGHVKNRTRSEAHADA
jgi:hypothetical protein